MIDPILSLSFNIQAQKGTYALLVGSGISRTAGIPTGWEVTLDLVRKLAHIEKESFDGDEAAWYEEKFGKEPDYSDLLGEIAPTSAAQQQLLRRYFEPSEDEREDGKKLPTEGHKAIARLIASGHVRVIVTTNFDRLLETAIEAEGIKPIVISSPDAVRGASPLAHSNCTVIKVHGDYLDQRIKNSPEALAKYDETTDRLLDQVFDEYGLIVCGWSADWDVALRNALMRCKSRRYPMYWTGLSEPNGEAKDLVAFHRAQFVKIEGADPFFSSLLEKVEALEEFDRPHPMSTQAAVATLKRYLSEDRHRIQLRDFLMSEAREASSSTKLAFSEAWSEEIAPEAMAGLMRRVEAVNEKMLHIFASGAFHATDRQARAFFDAFSVVLTETPYSRTGKVVLIDLQQYSSLLMVYAAGVAAVASENYSVLREIASRSIVVKDDPEKCVPAPARLYAQSVMKRDHARLFIPGMEKRLTPMSDHILELLHEPFANMVTGASQLEHVFDDFEYLWCLLHVDAQLQLGRDGLWAPFGSFAWRKMRRSHEPWFAQEVQNVLNGTRGWPPLDQGLFGGSIDRLKNATLKAAPMLDRVAREMW